ncbi:MAG TPA: hypothetical protein VKT26_01505 [Acetobacteraceae bacterium]|nr:hypothetical protein [Acetobacteraceae bacterium]
MESSTVSELRQNRFLIIVLTLSTLLTAGHFISEHYALGAMANASAQVQVGSA